MFYDFAKYVRINFIETQKSSFPVKQPLTVFLMSLVFASLIIGHFPNVKWRVMDF